MLGVDVYLVVCNGYVKGDLGITVAQHFIVESDVIDP